jgi:type IV secretion system protein VirD4
VSRQETARPLLTPGEVMQLPPEEELVMVSGHPPIRAAKLRYFEDRNFTPRVLEPPTLGVGRYGDCPAARPDDWSALAPLAHPGRPDSADANCDGGGDDGGLQRRPEQDLDALAPEHERDDLALLNDADDFDVETVIGARGPRRLDPRLTRAARLAALDPDDGMAL